MTRYDDLLGLPHPVSRRHPPMSRRDRAAQFAPFAALTGFDGVLDETGRRTEERVELDETRQAELDAVLRLLGSCVSEHPLAAFTYFRPDARKAGGAYVTVSGRVRRIDEVERRIRLTDGSEVPIDELFAAAALNENAEQ